MKISLSVSLLCIAMSAPTWAIKSVQEASEESSKPCSSSKEFITVFEYLKSNAEFDLSGDLSYRYASEAVKGCSGAAKRFIETAQTLRKSDLGLRDVLNIAKEVSQKGDVHSQVFNQIFKRAFAEDGFDLDIESSLKLAKSLSVDFDGDPKIGLQDFERVSEFCFKRKGLDLPLAKCAELALRIAQAGEEHEVAAADAFLSAFKYMTAKGGPSLAINEALTVSEEIVKAHPFAFENYKLAYEYALSKKGLAQTREEAMKFAKKMASATIVEKSEGK